jgi:hypothetical protein
VHYGALQQVRLSLCGTGNIEMPCCTTAAAHQGARGRSLESLRTRRDDTRRKILVGAMMLAKVDQGVVEESVLRGWLKSALTRADDRALFGL